MFLTSVSKNRRGKNDYDYDKVVEWLIENIVL